ncbi:MAG: hypothetical protein COB84_02655 [Rhodobacteraceae bacterium]|nr:MAG: hypothetical protein COB84_02655 [Paracoccaceae bacterium]
MTLENINIPIEDKIPTSLFNKRHNKTTDLINNQSEENYMAGKARPYRFEFTEEVFVSKVRVFTSGYSDIAELKVKIKNANGGMLDYVAKNLEEYFEVEVLKFCSEVTFTPLVKGLFSSSKTIKKVEIIGYARKQFFELEDAFFRLEGFKSDILVKEIKLREDQEKFKDEQVTYEGIIAKLKITKSELETDIGKTTGELKQANLDVENKKEEIRKLNDKISERQNENKQLSSERNIINEELSKSDAELKKIKKEIRNYPSDFSGLLNQGRRSLWIYLVLSLPFIAVICVLTYKLFSNAVDLSQLYNVEQDIDLWTIFLTRIPFVLVAFAILEVCGSLISGFIAEIVRINNQRLNMQKIAIIAKDITDIGVNDKDFTEEERFELETSVKLEMLKEHLKGYVSKDFEYKGTMIARILKRGQTKIETVANKTIDTAADPKNVVNEIVED